MYEKASQKAVNYRSGAFSLLLVGILGLIFLILIMLGVININIFGAARMISGVVMTLMFLIFVAVGVKSLDDARKYEAMADKEDKDIEDIHTWFMSNYSRDSIDSAVFWSGDEDRGLEQDYFKRYQYIKQEIEDRFTEISADLKEKMIEDLYNELYEDGDQTAEE